MTVIISSSWSKTLGDSSFVFPPPRSTEDRLTDWGHHSNFNYCIWWFHLISEEHVVRRFRSHWQTCKQSWITSESVWGDTSSWNNTGCSGVSASLKTACAVKSFETVDISPHPVLVDERSPDQTRLKVDGWRDLRAHQEGWGWSGTMFSLLYSHVKPFNCCWCIALHANIQLQKRWSKSHDGFEVWHVCGTTLVGLFHTHLLAWLYLVWLVSPARQGICISVTTDTLFKVCPQLMMRLSWVDVI